METIAVHSCPACGLDGTIILENCHDSMCGLPGNWKFRQCQQCKSLWLDPCPAREMIPSLYPTYYTHTQPSLQALQPSPGFLSQLKFAAKLAILEQNYGYQELSLISHSQIGTQLGKYLRFLPGLSKWGGYTVRYISKHPQGRLLDVGCGNGTFLHLMSELGWETVGLELDTQAAQVAASTGIKVLQCTAEDVQLEPASYDAVTLHHVLEHLPDPKNALINLASCLKPGGVFVSISPNPLSFIARWFHSNWRGLEPPRHLVLPTPKGYEFLLKDLGFEVKVCTRMTFTLATSMCRESIGIQKTGRINGYRGSLIPKLLGSIAQIASLILPNLGEEVICVAVKR